MTVTDLQPLENQHVQDWVDALRSGAYKQGFGCMMNAEDPKQRTYCCLGVACVLAEVPFAQSRSMPRTQWGWSNSGSAVHSHLPQWLRELLDLTRDEVANLTFMNDQQGSSFAEIADWIEYKVQLRELRRRLGEEEEEAVI